MTQSTSRRRICLLYIMVLGTPLLTGSFIHADEGPVATIVHPKPVDFHVELLPILRKKCLACHNATDAESDLILETPETILKGGLDGPVIVPGTPAESRLFALAAGREEPVMPPEDNEVGAEIMTPAELALLRDWIEQGGTGKVTATEQPIRWKPLPARVNPIFAAAQSPDGRFVSAGRANQIRVYDVLLERYAEDLVDLQLNDSPVAKSGPLAHLDLVQSIAFSHDGQWISSGGYRTVKLWRRVSTVPAAHQLPISNVSTAAIRNGTAFLVDSSGHFIVAEARHNDPVATLNEESSDFVSIAVSPSGRYIAALGQDSFLRIWNAKIELSDSKQSSSQLGQLAWTDDKTIAGAGTDHNVYIWVIDSNGRLGEPSMLIGHTNRVSAVAPMDETRLISASDDGDVRIWDIASRRTLRQLDHGEAVEQIAFAAPMNRLVTVGGDSAAKLWDANSGKLIAELNENPSLRWELEQWRLEQQVAKRHVDNFNQDIEAAEKRIAEEEESLKKAVEAIDGAKDERDTSKQKDEKAAKKRTAAKKKVAQLKQQIKELEQRVADASDEEDKKTSSKRTKAHMQKLVAAQKSLKAATVAASKAAANRTEKDRALESVERSVATSQRLLEDAKTAAGKLDPKRQAAMVAHQAAVATAKQAESDAEAGRHIAKLATMNPDGVLVATCNDLGQVVFWASHTGRPLQLVTLPRPNIVAISFNHDGQLNAISSDGHLISVNVTNRWQLVHTIGSPDENSLLEDRVTALSFSPDDSLLAIGGGQPSRSGQLIVYRVSDATPIREIEDAHSDTILDLAFSPDGRRLASCGADRFMKVIDVATGDILRTFEGHAHHVLSVSWRADGRVLATGGADKTVKLWKATDGSQMRTIEGFGKEVTSVQFAGATDVFFAACGDRHLYRCDTNGQRKSIGQGKDFLHVVTTNLQGQTIAFGGHDSVLRLVNDKGESLAELKPTD